MKTGFLTRIKSFLQTTHNRTSKVHSPVQRPTHAPFRDKSHMHAASSRGAEEPSSPSLVGWMAAAKKLVNLHYLLTHNPGLPLPGVVAANRIIYAKYFFISCLLLNAQREHQDALLTQE